LQSDNHAGHMGFAAILAMANHFLGFTRALLKRGFHPCYSD